MLVPSSPLCQKWVTVLLSPVCDGVCVCKYCMCMWIQLHTADDAERQTLCVVHHEHIQSVCVCVCVRVFTMWNVLTLTN